MVPLLNVKEDDQIVNVDLLKWIAHAINSRLQRSIAKDDKLWFSATVHPTKKVQDDNGELKTILTNAPNCLSVGSCMGYE